MNLKLIPVGWIHHKATYNKGAMFSLIIVKFHNELSHFLPICLVFTFA